MNDTKPATSLESVVETINAYFDLLQRAIFIVQEVPFYAFIDNDDSVALTLEGQEAVLSWSSYDSDYYGGGHLTRNETRFPADALLMSNAALSALRKKVKAEEKERNDRLRAAEAAVAENRKELRDRSEFARLTAKYSGNC